MQGNAIKYVTRYKDKNGIEDLEKAKHYIDMMISEHLLDGVKDDQDSVFTHIDFKELGAGSLFTTNDGGVSKIVYVTKEGDAKARALGSGREYWVTADGTYAGSDAYHKSSYTGAK